MKWPELLLALSLILALVVPASIAGTEERFLSTWGDGEVIANTGDGNLSKARSDTIYIMGGREDYTGRFETPEGVASWQGWTTVDATVPAESHWHLSDYLAEVTGADPGSDNTVAYCGDETIPSCGDLDPAGGYGNNWSDRLDWMGPAPDAGQATDVSISYYISHDMEPDYDFVFLQTWTAEGFVDVEVYGGERTVNLYASVSLSVPVTDYIGEDNDLIRLRWLFLSDGGWSDQDCLWQTQGAASIDDVTIDLNNGAAIYSTDFEDDPEQFDDQDFTNWETVPAVGVGDFAALWNDLDDIDPCRDNHSWQVAFIDDGIVVPGTGGTMCVTWCYGPGGYIVNHSGGLLGPDHHLHNEVISPVLTWPTEGEYGGAHLLFDVFRHNNFYWGFSGVFYTWSVRSVNTGNPADLESAGWQDREFVYAGGPEYYRHFHPISDLLVPGRTQVQIKLVVYEIGWIWGWDGEDGTPAPYFDNVTLVAFEFPGPAITARAVDLAQDTFPERGAIDYENLQANWCRFDMARDIDHDVGLDAGDSVVVSVRPLRDGAELTDPPRLHYLIATNPLFNEVRGGELGMPDADGRIGGYVEGRQLSFGGPNIETRWAFDLPDTGHFYPGDRMRYFIWVRDAIGGTEEPEVSLLPPDTTGFSRFYDPMTWEQKAGTSFTVRFLPTMFSEYPGDQPPILFWDDAGQDGREKWFYALRHLGFQEGERYDTYSTNAPASGVGNGLGGRATAELLQHYDVLLYSSGELNRFTITPPDAEFDEGDDIGVLDDWFAMGDKSAFFTGDNLASDLRDTDPGLLFLHQRLHLVSEVQSVQPYIANQSAPLVVPTEPNPVFWTAEAWIADGGCPDIKTFDGVSLLDNAQKIADFTGPDGEPQDYLFPAATYAHDPAPNNTVVYLPYDLSFVRTPRSAAKPAAPLPVRAQILEDVLFAFGHAAGFAVDVPAAPGFSALAYPNPFNPRTTIAFTLPRAGPVSVKIYDLRGALVRTLLDEAPRAMGRHEVIWAGDNDQEGNVASGVYCYEVRAGGAKKIAKIALLR